MTMALRTALLLVVLAALVASGVAPYDRGVWWAEVMPVLIAAPILIATARRFPLTPLACGLIAFFALILLHVAAALFHALVRRDGVFEAMSPLPEGRTTPER